MTHQPAVLRSLALLGVLALLAVAGCGSDGSDSGDAVPSTPSPASETRSSPGSSYVPSCLRVPRRVRRGDSCRSIWSWPEWVKREAKREAVNVPASVARAALSPADAKTEGAVARIEVPLLLQALTEKAADGPASEQEIAAYYRDHPREYARPETRYMRSVATDSRAQAAAAKRALEAGEGWDAVIRRYGTKNSEASPPSGNMGAQPGEMPDALGDAIYAAKRGTFNGPVQTDQAWYVFELTTIDPRPRQSLAQVHDALRERLDTQRQEKARLAVRERLLARYRPITVCNDATLLAACRNAPTRDLGSTVTRPVIQ